MIGGGGGSDQELFADLDAGVGQREDRNDHIARPWVVGPLQPLVRRQRLGQPYPGRLGELGGGLLAEEPEQVGGAFQITARGLVRGGEEPDRKT